MKKVFLISLFSICSFVSFSKSKNDKAMPLNHSLFKVDEQVLHTSITNQKCLLLGTDCATEWAWVETQVFGRILISCTMCSDNPNQPASLLAVDCLMDMIFQLTNGG